MKTDAEILEILWEEIVHGCSTEYLFINLITDLSDSEALNKKDEHGWTLLHYAACVANPVAIEMLLKYGADPETKNNKNETPLQLLENKTMDKKPPYYEDCLKLLKKNCPT